jgi:branched-chain amino acid transport system ATP-binding protein
MRWSHRLHRVGELFPVLPRRLGQRAGTLSGGEQKMLCVARAMMSEPQVMLVDEISEGLQPSMRTVLIRALLDERDRRRTTILLVEQNLEFAFALADRYCVLKGGLFVAEGHTSDAAKQLVMDDLAV